MITLGTKADGTPFQVPRENFEVGHVDFRGMSGAGKSTTEGQRLDGLMSTGRDFFLGIDLAGSIELRNTYHELAQKHGRRFREFSLTHQREAFDPFQSFRNEHNPAVLAAWSIAAFQIDWGAGYGSGYFTSVNHQVIEDACAAILRRGSRVYMQSLVDEISKSSKTKETEAYNTLRPLKHFPQLDSESRLDQINIGESLANGDVVYMSLDCLTAPLVARVIAGLASATAIMECISLNQRNKMKHHAFVSIDEFSQLASPAWGTWLTASRKHRCMFSLMYQSTAQLSKSGKLDEIVFQNCRTHFYFTCVGKSDVDQLRELSSEVRSTLGGTSGFGISASINSREVVDRKLSVNEILDVSATDREFFAVVNDGKGHKDPIRVRSLDVPLEILKQRGIAPEWMSCDGSGLDMVVPSSSQPDPNSIKTHLRMRELFAKQLPLDGFDETKDVGSPGATSYRSNVPSVNGQKSLFAN